MRGFHSSFNRIAYLGLILILTAACAPSISDLPDSSIRPTRTPLVVVALVPPTPLPTLPATPPVNPTGVPDAASGINMTLSTYTLTNDPDGSLTSAIATLRDFADPNGVYRGAWWFQNDNAADIYEVIAVLFYTEANQNVKVQQAIAARYLWYCAGTGVDCNDSQLINFLSYFQPWREPWAAGARFTNAKAEDFLPFAHDLVLQQPGILTALIPGADRYVRNPDGIDARTPVDWPDTPFHFANVDPTWDTYLRQALGRGSNGANRLWVLTMAEAEQVCPSAFVCQNMTKVKQ